MNKSDIDLEILKNLQHPYSPQSGTFVLTVFAGSMLKTQPQNASWVRVGFVPWQHVVDAPEIKDRSKNQSITAFSEQIIREKISISDRLKIEHLLPSIRIRSPPHSVARAGTFPSPFSPTLNPTQGGPSGAAIVGKLYCVPAVIAEPQGPSGQTW